MSRATLNICQSKEEKQSQAKMSDSVSPKREEMPACVKRIMIYNKDYKKIICISSRCGKAIKFDQLRYHLGRRHHMNVETSSKATKMARKLGWGEELDWDVQPEDGSAPQVGVAVKEGFRCRHCRRYMSESEEDVEDHCNSHDHGVAEGSAAEHIRYQSWHGYYNVGYWIVDEDKTGEVGVDSGDGTGFSTEERVDGDGDWEIV